MSGVPQATKCASEFVPAMTYEALTLSRSASHQLGCMILDDRSLLTLEVLEGAPFLQPFVTDTCQWFNHCQTWKSGLDWENCVLRYPEIPPCRKFKSGHETLFTLRGSCMGGPDALRREGLYKRKEVLH